MANIHKIFKILDAMFYTSKECSTLADCIFMNENISS